MYFSKELASTYGVTAALILNHFSFWITKNKTMKRNRRDGKWWTYMTLKEIHETFPFYSISTIKRTIAALVEKKVIARARYNRSSYDRTSWYTILDETILARRPEHSTEEHEPFQEPEVTHRRAQNDTTIPDTLTYIKNNIQRNTAPTPEERTLQKELAAYLTEKQIDSFLAEFSLTYLTEKFEAFKRLLATSPDKVRNPSSFLYSAISKNWNLAPLPSPPPPENKQKPTNPPPPPVSITEEAYNKYIFTRCQKVFNRLPQEKRHELEEEQKKRLSTLPLFAHIAPVAHDYAQNEAILALKENLQIKGAIVQFGEFSRIFTALHRKRLSLRRCG